MIKNARLGKIFVCLTLLVSMMSTLTIREADATDFAGGNGTPESPYIIETAFQLNNVRDQPRKSYKLNADIDLSAYASDDGGKGWKPIGTYPDFYRGIFDGNGHKVTGLHISRSTEDYVGLFGFINYGIIANLSVVGATVTGRNYTGIIAGYNQSFTIDQVQVSGTVNGNNNVGGLFGAGSTSVTTKSSSVASITGASSVGGLAGSTDRGSISDSYAEGQVYGTDSVGGLVGHNEGTITQSYATGNVQSNGSVVGGLIGRNTSGITNSFALGSVQGAANVGGLIGENSSTVGVSNSYAAGLVTSTISWQVKGGFVGSNYNSPITGSYWDATASGLSAGYGTNMGIVPVVTGLTTANMRNASMFTAWDFATVWALADGASPPYLRSALPLWLNELTVTTNAGITQTIIPGFDALTGTYSTSVSGDTSSVTVSGTAVDSSAVVTVNGGTNLTAGSNVVTVTVTGADLRMSKSYAITVIKAAAALATNADLSDLKVNGTTVYEFTSQTLDYSYDILNVVTSVTVTAATYDPNATLIIDNSSGLLAGSNLIGIRVLAQDGTTSKNYTLTVNRAASDFAGGSGTVIAPYEIATADQLDNVRYYLDKTFKLTGDIDLSAYASVDGGKGWTPIGGYGGKPPFVGSMDGNGHTISGLFINRVTDNNIGLFGSAQSATFKNLIMDQATVVGKDLVGILTGVIRVSGHVDQVYVSGSVNGNSDVGGLIGTTSQNSSITKSGSAANVTGESNFVGGLVGHLFEGNISDSYSEGNVYAKDMRAGGLVGDSSGAITGSYATGAVRADNLSAGGLVGANSGTITDSFALGTVKAGDSPGGLVGTSTAGSISNSYAAGKPTSNYTLRNGGFIGTIDNTTITNSFWDTTASAVSTAWVTNNAGLLGISGLTTANMQLADSYSGWDFDTVWAISEEKSYPYLWEAPPLWLKDLSLMTNTGSAAALSTNFRSLSDVYSVTVPNNVVSVTATATAADPNAAVTIQGGTSLTVGANAMSVTIAGSDVRAARAYTITVTRAAASTDTTLSALSLSGVTLSTSFASGTITYTASVGNSVSSTTVAATTTDDGAVITAADLGVKALAVGPNMITVNVTAEDGTTTGSYTVVVTRAAPASSDNEIIAFSFTQQTGAASIDATMYSVAIEVAQGTDLSNLIATFDISAGATSEVGGIAQISGITANDFSGAVIYTIKAADGSTQDWTINVTVAVALSDAKDIVSFSLPGQTSPAVINETALTVTLAVYGSDLSQLVASFTLSAGATAHIGNVIQMSGATSNDFTAPVAYLITAQDGTTQSYTITVVQSFSTNAELSELRLDGTTVLGFSGSTFGYMYDVVHETTSVAVTAMLADVNATVTIIGGGSLVVGNNRIEITVTAQDGSQLLYTITVRRAPAVTPNNSGGDTNPSGGEVAQPIDDGELTLEAGVSGTARLGDDLIVFVPEGATDQRLHLIIERLMDTSTLFKQEETVLSPVIEVLKNFMENFKKPVNITLKFDSNKVQSGQRPSIYYYDERTEVWVRIGGIVTGNKITAEVDHFTKFVVLSGLEEVAEQPDALAFLDTEGHWAQKMIQQAVEKGIALGYPDGRFLPNGHITRAEFAVMLARALNLQGEDTQLSFGDKDEIGAWARKATAQIVKAGIVSGYSDGSFRPDARITRTEMVVMIARALGERSDRVGSTGFVDDKDIPPWAKGAVELAKRKGIVNGRGNNSFKPNNTATRAEALTIILMMIEIRK